MSRIFRPPLVLSLAVAATAFLGAGAAAAQTATLEEPNMINASQAVRYVASDLGAPAGARSLLVRLRAAASSVCGDRPVPTELQAWVDYSRCRHDAVSAAVARIDAPALTAQLAPREQAAIGARRIAAK